MQLIDDNRALMEVLDAIAELQQASFELRLAELTALRAAASDDEGRKRWWTSISKALEDAEKNGGEDTIWIVQGFDAEMMSSRKAYSPIVMYRDKSGACQVSDGSYRYPGTPKKAPATP
jgi:hypothetical protein